VLNKHRCCWLLLRQSPRLLPPRASELDPDDA
jgi:hypothetical protein